MKLPFIALAALLVACQAAPKNEGGWLSFNEGLALATKQGKPILVDVYTDWCHWCKVMDKDTFGNDSVKKVLTDSFVTVKLNAESTTEKISYQGRSYSAGDFAAQLGVEGYPCLVFFDKSGAVVTKVPGFVKPAEFLPMLEFIKSEKYKSMNYEAFIKSRRA